MNTIYNFKSIVADEDVFFFSLSSDDKSTVDQLKAWY